MEKRRDCNLQRTAQDSSEKMDMMSEQMCNMQLRGKGPGIQLSQTASGSFGETAPGRSQKQSQELLPQPGRGFSSTELSPWRVCLTP